MFSAAPKESGEGDGVDPAEFQRYFVAQGRFTAGVATRYAPSMITAEPTYQHLAEGFPVGMRFHSAPVVRLADAKPVAARPRRPGRRRLAPLRLRRPDDPRPGSRAASCASSWRRRSRRSPRYTPAGADPDAVIDVRAVFQQGHRDLAVDDAAAGAAAAEGQLRPDRLREGRSAPTRRPATSSTCAASTATPGCMVVVRPDQYVAHVLPLDAHEAAGRLLRRDPGRRPVGHAPLRLAWGSH